MRGPPFQNALHLRPVLSVHARFARVATLGAGVAGAVAFGLAAGFPGPMLVAVGVALALGGYLVGVALAGALLRRGFAHPTLGLCNVVTLLRMALAAGLLAALVGTPPPWAVFGVAVVALALDGADGWLARREGRVSDFGARFDMEVDSALALILALTAWSAQTAGAAVLLLGLPRYAFVLAGLAMPWLNHPLPDRYSRKVVCVVQIAALAALHLPNLPAGVAEPVVALVAAALAWSFGRDTLWLWRARG